MWKLTDLNQKKNGAESLFEKFEHYVLEKNLNFIVAGGTCLNQRSKDLGKDKTRGYLEKFADCDFSMIALFNDSPKSPFIAADINIEKKLARVQYLVDFNQEAAGGKASPFYSKVLGAFATHFFAVHPELEQIWFPFTIEKMVGSKMCIQSDNSGTAILR
jgi:hypothetical protein